MSLDLVENWLNTVSFSRSGSLQTRSMYRLNFNRFLEYAGKIASQIQEDYEQWNDERKFKRAYAQLLMGFIGHLQKQNYSHGTISVAVNAVRSFFKYNDLPLGFIPNGSNLIEFHNRDITKDEIVEVVKLANPRDRAFFVVMAQSGLRPQTIANLKIKDLEGILDADTPVPCKIEVRQENTKGKFQGYFTFISKESVDAIKDYLKTRKQKLTVDDYLFAAFGDESQPVNSGVLTHIFRRIVERLRDNKVLDYETKSKKINVQGNNNHPKAKISRGELRLYNLRKFFRKHAGQAGADYVNFWMGHTSALGVDLHYFSRDVELHRQIYKDKAMPFLRLETRTPTETEKEMEALRKENLELRRMINNIQTNMDEIRKQIQMENMFGQFVQAKLEKQFAKKQEGSLMLRDVYEEFAARIRASAIMNTEKRKEYEELLKKLKAAVEEMEPDYNNMSIDELLK